MLVTMGEGSGTLTEPHHTPSPEAPQTSPTTHSSPSLPPVTTESLPTIIPSDTTQLRQYTRRARIAQSSTLPPVADEPASPIGDDSQGKACPTDSGLEAEHDMANITKTSTLPSDSSPRVTSLAADKGSMQQKLNELTALCTSLQRKQSEMTSKITAQDLEISQLKARVKLLKDREGGGIAQSREDAPINERSLDEGDEASEKGSDDTEEMVTVLTSLDAATILSSGVSVSIYPVTEVYVAEVPISSGSIPTASPPGTGVPTSGVPTGSDVVPTASPIFTTATVATPYTRRKAEELQIMIDELDMNNETVAKYLQEYYQFAGDLPIRERIELISNLVKYQDHYANVLKLEQDSAKNVKTLKEVPEEKLKEIMQLIPVEEHFDKEDLNQLWALVKETLNIRPAANDKEKELWVELKRLYEPNVEDQLWTHTKNLMHASVEWKLYDTCGVHHVISKDQEMFMLAEKDYPLKKGMAIVMISYKLQVENYSQMANDLILKIHKLANSPRQQDD
nr:leucine-rich repeat protein [Tanacetum cinerariifolium]